MKYTTLLLSLVFSLNFSGFANDEKKTVPSLLKSVTVYRNGAEMQHTAAASLKQGNNDLVIDGISNKIDINSLQIGNDGKIAILSMEFSTDYLKTAVKSINIKRLEDSLEIINKELGKIQVILKTDNELLDLLKANKEIRGTQTGLSVAELTKMMDYYKIKTLELQNEMSLQREKEKRLNDVADKIKSQVAEEEQKNTKTVGKILLQLNCPAAGNFIFTISYITPTAYWNPYYDLRVENTSKPINLSYKAKLVQTSGIDWKQIKLSLSTSTPNQNGNAPILNSWFLHYILPVASNNNNPLSNSIGTALQGKVAGVQLDEVVVVGYGSKKKTGIEIRGVGSIQAASPMYVVNGELMSEQEFKNKNIQPGSIAKMDVLKDAAATSHYGSRADNGVIVITLKDNLGDYVSVNDKELNVMFDIDLPYDVSSNGKEQSVTLKEISVPVLYKHYAVPRLDKEVYLLGEVADWEALNLLAGEANIIFEGTHVGKSYIDPNTTLDTLNLTLGKDKRIVVKKEKMVDFSSVKFLGSNKKQTFTYEITVKNNKKEKVQMLLKDQYPLSTNKDIEVELLESSGASINSDLGVLNWTLELAPGETKKFKTCYSIKYPKDRVINSK